MWFKITNSWMCGLPHSYPSSVLSFISSSYPSAIQENKSINYRTKLSPKDINPPVN